ncbi:MFS transporter [Paenibacillus larvae]
MQTETMEGRRKVFSPFVIQLLMIMFIVEFVKGALLLTILPIYMKTVLGASAFIVGWTLAAQYIGDNAFRTPVGWFIDKFGYRISMLTGVICTFGSVVMMATLTQYGWIILACALLGIGTAPLWPAVISGTTEVAGEKAKGVVMSVVYMAWLSGTGLGPVIINFFISDNSYTKAFWLLLISMGLVVLIAFFLPNQIRKNVISKNDVEFAESLTQSAPKTGTGKRWERVRQYLGEVKRDMNKMAVSRLLFPAMFIQTFALGILTPILTIYAREILHLSPNQYSLFLVVGGGVIVLLLMPVGKLVDKFGTTWFLTAGLIISSASLMAITFMPNMTLIYVLVIALGLGYAMIIPSWNALIASAVPPEKRGVVWGFFLTIEGLGMIVGPIISGKLWDLFNYHVPFITSGFSLLVLLILGWRISSKQTRLSAA